MPDELLINILGFLASTLSFVLWLPQARSTWKNRRNPGALAGVSLGTQWLVLVNATLWGVYAVLTNAFWAGAPGLVNFPLAAATIYIVLRGRRKPQLAGS